MGKEDLYNNASAIFSAGSEVASGTVGEIKLESDIIALTGQSYISIDHNNLALSDTADNHQGTLSIESQSLFLNNSAIGANSYGSFPASNIELLVHSNLWSSNSFIASFANTNNGGNIDISGNADFLMNNSTITTSSTAGDGGNISLSSNSLIMDGGFIQANTSKGKQGGDITINVPYLITRNALLPQIGGIRAQSFTPHSGRNIIQATAPEGNPGELSLAIPKIDISNSLATLSSHFMEVSNIADNPCTANKTQNSSLISTGRGGVPHKVNAPSAVSLGGQRLEQFRHKSPLNSADKTRPEAHTVATISKKHPSLWGCHTL